MVLPLIPLLGVLGPTLLSLAPDLAKWLGGNRAGDIATQAIQVAQAVTGTSDAAAAEAALRTLSPERRMELQIQLANITRQAEQDERQAELAKIKADLESAADARRTMVELNKAGSSLAWMPAFQTMAVGFTFIGALIALFAMQFWGVGDIKSGVREILVMILGILAGEFRGACQFWIGGSRAGSQAANAVVAQAVGASPPPRPAATPSSEGPPATPRSSLFT